MKVLKDLLAELKYEVISGKIEGCEISKIITDNRKVCEDCLFVCIEGANFDGHSAALEVSQKGAKVLVVSKEVEAVSDTVIIKVDDTREALAYLAAAYYDHPAAKLKTIGITGTKGKTTTTYLVKSVLEKAGHKVGLIGTIEAVIGDEIIPAKNTTPESIIVQEYFARMVEKGIDTVVMEVSSQALMMYRVAGFTFDIGVFTNIEPDHIGPNEHESFEDYLECKSRLFKQCKVGVINGDDAHVEAVLKNATCKVLKYGFTATNDFYAKDEKLITGAGYLGVDFKVAGIMDFEVSIHNPGRFSIMNALCAIAICNEFNTPIDDIKAALLSARAKGRIEIIHIKDEYTLMIDYAHNAMALESLLTTLKEYNPGRLVSLFGCGGNRSKLRRFEMGEVSGRLADLTIITSDNPRFEKPLDIIADIRTGIEKTDGEFVEIPDRKEAIKYAIENAKPGDVIVLAGKGHEDYQEIEGKKYPMDERVLIEEIKEELGY